MSSRTELYPIPDDLRRAFSQLQSGETKERSGEMLREEYLASLSDADRRNVLNFLDFASLIRPNIDMGFDVRFGVLAVGSTVRPNATDAPNDINLRILNSGPTPQATRNFEGDPTDDDAFTGVQGKIIRRIRDLGLDYYVNQDVDIKYLRTISETVRIYGNNGAGHGVPFEQGRQFFEEEITENSPGFVIRHDEGLPLHVAISGVNFLPMKKYIDLEKSANAHFSVLMQDEV